MFTKVLIHSSITHNTTVIYDKILIHLIYVLHVCRHLINEFVFVQCVMMFCSCRIGVIRRREDGGSVQRVISTGAVLVLISECL